MRMLNDLAAVIAEIKENYLTDFNSMDVSLSEEFKKGFTNYQKDKQCDVVFNDTSAIIINSAGQRIFAPNQWFAMATYAVPLIEEVMAYREWSEYVFDNDHALLGFLANRGMEKKDAYRQLKDNKDDELLVEFRNAIIRVADEKRMEPNTIADLVCRFVTDYAWWLGGKGIERSNDYYVSPALSVLNLVNASQGYVATLSFIYATDPALHSLLSTIEMKKDPADIKTRERAIIEETEAPKEYGKKEFLEDVFMTEEEYDDLRNLLLRKKNVILQGAPGVGKTFLAKKLAYSIINKCDDSFLKFVQFHQSYSYEDFIMGYKPCGGTWELKDGVFYDFVKNTVEKNGFDNYFLIIDEINRGNISKIFGEVMILLESDKRNSKNGVSLAYKNDVEFHLPENLFIIGMMNTADRSLAMMDYALRRRFCFFNIKPAFDSPKFKDFIIRRNGLSEEMAKTICQKMIKLNALIADEKSSGLGEGFCVGHSYFCSKPVEGQSEKEWYESIIKYEIAPLLYEYWWDEPDKAETSIEELNLI